MNRKSLLQILPRIVARVPAKVHAKLLIAFLAITVLLIALGAVGLQALSDTNQRAKDLVELQRKIAAYRQLQHDTTAQLYSVASALLVHDERTLDATLRQLNQFGYDLDRLQFVAKDEVELLGQVRKDYDRFIQVVSQSVELIRAGKIAAGNQLQIAQANPLAERLERLMNQLVNRAEADMVASIDASETAYSHSRRIVIGFAVGSMVLALILGYTISWSVVGPVQQMDARFKEIASGDFSRRIEVPNRDELGTLAANLNRMSEELGRLYQQIETRNRELGESLEQQTATAEILGVIASSPTDIQPVLDVIAENAARVCGAKDAHILRVEGDLLRMVSSYGRLPVLDGFEEGIRISRDWVTGRAVVDGHTVHVHDLAADSENEFPEGKDFARRFGHRTTLATPLVREGVPIGAILIRREKVHPFSDKQIKLLETFADQAVIAIENVRLFQELQTRTRELARSVEELKALGEVGQAVSSTLDLATVLTTIVTQAVQLSETHGGVVYEYDEAAEEFQLRATHRVEQELLDALKGNPIRLGEGAVGKAVAIRAPVQIADALNDPEYSLERLRPILARSGYRSILAVPMLRDRQIIGGLVVLGNELGNFSTEAINLLQTFAAQSVLAIQNARLFRGIEEKSQQLEVANRHKSDFLARVSHDLRTPLNAIMGFTRIVVRRMEGQMPDIQKENLQKVLISSEHLLNLINGLLDLAKIDAGKMEVSADTFRVEDIINMTTATVEPLLKDGRVRIVRDVTPDLPPLKTDRDKLKQILLNLLSNAAKFTEQGEIRVSASRENGTLKLAVSDTGIGMKQKSLEHIFEEFQQAEKTTASKYGGTGLGLAIVKKFINLMGGEIVVESEEGRGSKFTITLPMERKQ
jgi:signal transduction histidine kinase/HAMP domain-containing protein